MIEVARKQVAQHARSGVLVDTNLLLLLLVGRLGDERLIETFKRTRAYEKIDYLFLEALLQSVAWTITPQVAAETSNLGKDLPDGKRELFFRMLATQLENARERSVALKLTVIDPAFLRFGITDAGIACFKRRCPLVITDDLPLYLELDRRKRPVLKYSHLRLAIRGLEK